MNSAKPSSFLRRARGSALLTAVIFTTVMVIMVASILGWSLNERKLNTRSIYWNESRNAAEALAEYGAAQITYMGTNFDTWPTMDPGLLIPTPVTNLPLALPYISGTTTSVFNPNQPNGNPNQNSNNIKDSHIDSNPLEIFSGTKGTSSDPYGLEVIGGPLVKIANQGGLDYLDPKAQGNDNDPFAGLLVHRWDSLVLAKATAIPADGSEPVTDYVQETISLRGAPLFNFFVFYSINDMEIYPGANMTITGPVHSNGDIYVSATGGATLTFNGIVSATGNIFHDALVNPASDGQTPLDNSPVLFQGPSGLVNMYDGAKWDDSTMGKDATNNDYGPDTPGSNLNSDLDNADFLAYASKSTTWKNFVLTAPMGVLSFNPTGFNQALVGGNDPSSNQYIPDSIYVDNGDQAIDSGEQINLPNNTTPTKTQPVIDKHVVDPTTSTVTKAKGNVSYINDPTDSEFNINASPLPTYYLGRRGLELSKYANLANLYILVQVTPGTGGNPDTANIIYFGPYNETHLGASLSNGTIYGPNGGVLLGTPAAATAPSWWTGGANWTGTSISGIKVAGNTVTTNVEPPELVSFVPYKLDGTNTYVTQGLYDQREQKGVDLVQIDMMALNLALMDVNAAILNNQSQPITPPTSAIININGPYTTTPADNIWGSGNSSLSNNANDNTSGQINNTQTSGGWNGVIYVDVEWMVTPPATPPAGTIVAIGIGNGQTTVTQVSSKPTITNSLDIANTYNAGNTPTGSLSAPGAITFPFTPSPNNLINLIPNNPASLSKTAPIVVDSKVGRDSASQTGAPPTGLAIATNAPVYLEGNFNADGSTDNTDPVVAAPNGTTVTGSSTLPDDETSYTLNSVTNLWTWSPNATTAEVPVAIVGDAVTFLSPTYFGGTANGQGKPPKNFVFPTGNQSAFGASGTANPVLTAIGSANTGPSQNSTLSNAYNSKKIVLQPPVDGSGTTEDLEVAAAIVAGIRPTDSHGGPNNGGTGSGGVHNFPRFLEEWNNGSAVLIRGSLVNLYASKFALGRYTSGIYYQAPHRHWGFDDLFESGVFPPATPQAWSIRRMNFNDLSATQYSNLRQAAYPNDSFAPLQ
jgi:hypothetical protein